MTQVRDDIYLVDVVARATDEQRVSLATLRTMQVPLPNGRTVPLSQFATFEYAQEYPLIWRRDRVPTLTVQADVARALCRRRWSAALAPAVEDLARPLPPAIPSTSAARSRKAQIAGVRRRRRAGHAADHVHVLMVQLQSFQRLFIVLSVAPLGLIGVVGALLLSGRPLGFVAILGILALLGMITKNAVILIGQIEAERAPGKDVWQAAIEPAAPASVRSC